MTAATGRGNARAYQSIDVDQSNGISGNNLESLSNIKLNES